MCCSSYESEIVLAVPADISSLYELFPLVCLSLVSLSTDEIWLILRYIQIQLCGVIVCVSVWAGSFMCACARAHVYTNTLHPYILNPSSYTLHTTACVLHPTPYILHPTPYILHPTPYTLHPTPYTLDHTPYTLHPTLHTIPKTQNAYA